MNYDISPMEALIRKHAPLMMRVGAPLREEYTSTKMPAKWRAPLDRRIINRMKRLRECGMTIGEIARKCRVTWQSAWVHSGPTKKGKP